MTGDRPAPTATPAEPESGLDSPTSASDTTVSTVDEPTEPPPAPDTVLPEAAAAAGDCRAVARVLSEMARSAEPARPGPVPHPRSHSPARGARVRLDGERADVEAVAQALAEGRAHVEHLDVPERGRRGGYLAYGRLTAHPGGTPRV